ncbi:hypothetical protein JNJ66_00845 [Candidatus Saccharibacteria bacterium]|nr:hypothetical protein [Candidatus Saccharibacteria bacterium]
MFSTLLAFTGGAQAGASATHIPATLTGDHSYTPNNLAAHRDGSATATYCSHNYPQGYAKTYAPDGSTVTTLSRTTNSAWHAFDCSKRSMTTGHDGTVYLYEIKNSSVGQENRLAAYKDGALVWAKSFTACSDTTLSTEQRQARMAYPTLGNDNVLYAVGLASGYCSSNYYDNKLYALDINNGETLDDTPVKVADINGHTPIGGLIVPLESGVAFLDHEITYSNGVAATDRKYVRYYDFTNDSLAEATSKIMICPIRRTVIAEPFSNSSATKPEECMPCYPLI